MWTDPLVPFQARKHSRHISALIVRGIPRRQPDVCVKSIISPLSVYGGYILYNPSNLCRLKMSRHRYPWPQWMIFAWKWKQNNERIHLVLISSLFVTQITPVPAAAILRPPDKGTVLLLLSRCTNSPIRSRERSIEIYETFGGGGGFGVVHALNELGWRCSQEMVKYEEKGVYMIAHLANIVTDDDNSIFWNFELWVLFSMHSCGLFLTYCNFPKGRKLCFQYRPIMFWKLFGLWLAVSCRIIIIIISYGCLKCFRKT